MHGSLAAFKPIDFTEQQEEQKGFFKGKANGQVGQVLYKVECRLYPMHFPRQAYNSSSQVLDFCH